MPVPSLRGHLIKNLLTAEAISIKLVRDCHTFSLRISFTKVPSDDKDGFYSGLLILTEVIRIIRSGLRVKLCFKAYFEINYSQFNR